MFAFLTIDTSMPDTLRIVFMGTPEFAVPSLEILVAHGHQVVAVVTAPDKPAGRGMKLTISPVKEAALRLGIPILQPEKLKSEAFLAELRALKADLQIVVAFRMLPEVVWNMPPKGTFNLHASLLPQYRGAAPINWAIMHGDTVTGVTTFFLRHEIDTGDLIMQETQPIHPDDDAGSLYARLMQQGGQVVLRTVEQIAAGTVKAMPQPQMSDLRVAPKLFKDNTRIDFGQSAEQVRNFVRGLSPYPGAWMTVGGKFYKVFRVKILSESPPADMQANWWADGRQLCAKTAAGWLSIEELQPEGKKRMSAEEFLRGNRWEVY